jgi:hypothetical protein
MTHLALHAAVLFLIFLYGFAMGGSRNVGRLLLMVGLGALLIMTI